MDMLDFFVSDRNANSKKPQALNFTQYVDAKRKSSIYAKSPSQCEWHTWDNKYIYLVQDSSVGAVRFNDKIATSYRIDGGIWLKRDMKPNDFFEVYPSAVHWLDKNCVEVYRYTTWKYYIFFEALKVIDFKGDIGKQEAAIIRFDYYSMYEKFFYCSKWGWVRWEAWKDKKMLAQTEINRFSKPIAYKAKCGMPQIAQGAI